MANPSKPCPKCGQHGHDARRHNGRRRGDPVSPKQRAHYLNLKARSYQAQTGRVCDPVTERDWAELDGVL